MFQRSTTSWLVAEFAHLGRIGFTAV